MDKIRGDPKEKNKGGRPSIYNTVINKNILQLINYWVIKGYTEQMIADRLGINVDTLIQWKKDERKKEFSDALKGNRDTADDLVEGSLFKRALSGDVTACIYWLKNRRPKEWNERKETALEGNINITIVDDIPND